MIHLGYKYVAVAKLQKVLDAKKTVKEQNKKRKQHTKNKPEERTHKKSISFSSNCYRHCSPAYKDMLG